MSVKTTPTGGTDTTTQFTYGDTAHPDRLTKFGTKAITYDALGCPLSYDGKTFAWTRGKLTSVSYGSAPSLHNYNYIYDAYGRRVRKSYSTLILSGAMPTQVTADTSYDYDHSGRLIREYVVNSSGVGTMTTTEKLYLYDESGVIGMIYTSGSTSTTYYFLRNIQGDVVAIYDVNGNKVTEYAYDAYGNCTILSTTNSTIANANPFRYRGYYLDAETGWYFLNARYYNPEWRRFISPDDTAFLDSETPNGLNLYCYCGNDPVNYADPSGNFPVLAVILGITAAVGFGLSVGGVIADNNLVTAIGLSMVTIPALISGGMALACVGATATMVIGGITIAAGIGTALFASAEYQEAFTSNNWMSGTLGEGFYNGLMLTTAGIATLGTFASLAASSLQIKKVLEVGKIRGVRAPKGYPGIRFVDKSGVIRSLEFHLPHQGHGIHLQLNNWWLNHPQYVGQYYRAFAKRFEIFKFWKGWS